ncbi:MAG TPA: type II toxin-antitoxin system RelE/ParE family toxin [Armatimonadota bacterium]|jgi:phage-related protein
MPSVNVVFYREEDGTVPVADWLGRLPREAKIKCIDRLVRLKQLGHEMRRPESDYLGDDLYELRIRFQSVHYRMLYFFHGRTVAIIAHGLVKEREVPKREIDVALRRKERFAIDPVRHTSEE